MVICQIFVPLQFPHLRYLTILEKPYTAWNKFMIILFIYCNSMSIPSPLLWAEKWELVNLDYQNIDVSEVNTIWDVIRTILDHVDKNPWNSTGETPADRLRASIVIPLRTALTQQIASTKDNATKKLLWEELAMAGFCQDEMILREKLERLLNEIGEI